MVLFLALNIPFSTSAIVDFRSGIKSPVPVPASGDWKTNFPPVVLFPAATPPVTVSVPDQKGPAKGGFTPSWATEMK